jgi:hypothetical protein
MTARGLYAELFTLQARAYHQLGSQVYLR